MFVIIVTILFCGFLYVYIKNRERYYLGNKIPGPTGWPILGNVELMTLPHEEIFEYFPAVKEKYGSIYKLWMLNELWVVISNTKDAEILLTDKRSSTKSNHYKVFNPWLGTGLLTSSGAKWFKRRKAITPAFHFKILEEFVKVFDHHSNILITKFQYFNTESPFDIHDNIATCTLSIIIQTAMGVSIDEKSNNQIEYFKAIRNTLRISLLRAFNPLWANNLIFALSQYSKTLKDSLKVIQMFNDKVIQERRLELLNAIEINNEVPTVVEVSTKKRMALLDILLHARIDDKPLTDEDIREEVNTFMFEGHDTTACGLIFCLYQIAQYPNIQQKVFDEIEAVIGTDKTKPVSYQQLNNLKYLEMVIKETLRLYPSVPYISRQVYEKLELSNGMILPPDSLVILGIYLLGRDPKLFPNPEEFIPERFDPMIETNEKKHPFGYIPFSAGQRNCIGQKFAMLEMKTILSKILRYYIVQLPDPKKLRLSFEVVLVVRKGIHLILKKR